MDLCRTAERLSADYIEQDAKYHAYRTGNGIIAAPDHDGPARVISLSRQ
jgi:hypothetical protein